MIDEASLENARKWKNGLVDMSEKNTPEQGKILDRALIPSPLSILRKFD